MKRLLNIPKRKNLEKKFADLGSRTYNPKDPDWQEGMAYRFTQKEVDDIIKATNDIIPICNEACQYVIEKDLFSTFKIEGDWKDYIIKSWERKDPCLWARYDFIFDGTKPPKLMEVNYGRVGNIIEAAVLQREWAKEHNFKQFNTIEDTLIKAWAAMKEEGSVTDPVYFMGNYLDMNEYEALEFLMAACLEAGLDAEAVDIRDFDWDGKAYIDHNTKKPIHSMLKHFSWEENMGNPFAQRLTTGDMRVIDPVWTMVMSNKAMLPILWEIAPNHPNLLPTYYDTSVFDEDGSSYVEKPLHGYQGKSITIVDPDDATENIRDFGEEGYIYQEYIKLRDFDEDADAYPVCGSWVINDEACGIAIREDETRITTEECGFVPYYIL